MNTPRASIRGLSTASPIAGVPSRAPADPPAGAARPDVGQTAPRTPETALLSPARRLLVGLMREIRYGRIEGLLVQRGEPVFEPPPRVIRAVKLAGGDEPAIGEEAGDGALKAQVHRLLRQLDAMGSGRIECLEVQGGLPFRLTIESHRPL